MGFNKRFVTVLTPEGEFLRAKNGSPEYQIGQEIVFVPVTYEKKASFSSLLRSRMVWSAAVLILGLLFIPFYQNNQVYAYLSIDINPSMEMSVNEKYQVIKLVAYNDDGERIIEQLKGWKYKDAETVVSGIIHEIKQQGYLKENQRLVLASVFAKNEAHKKETRWDEEVEEIKEEIEKETFAITVIKGSKDEREKAAAAGLTTGKYKEMKLKKEQGKTKKQVQEQPGVEKESAVNEETPVNTGQSQQQKKTVPVIKNSPVPPGQLKKESETVKNNQIPEGTNTENQEILKQVEPNEAQNKANVNQGNKIKENNENRNKENDNVGNQKGSEDENNGNAQKYNLSEADDKADQLNRKNN